MSEPNWYHVFDSTNNMWLADDKHEWSRHYHDAAEFTSYELARDIAAREIRNKGPDYDGVVIVLADCGVVET